MTTHKQSVIIGKAIAKAKKKRNITNYRIQTDIDVTPATMKRIESGCHCSANTLFEVAEYLKMEITIKNLIYEEKAN